MTGMLASVSSLSEAKMLLHESIDILDIKDPKTGALGALDTSLINDIVSTVDGFVTTSATIGDIDCNSSKLYQQIIEYSETGVDIVKVGMFASEPSRYFIDNISKATDNNINIVIVLFAEDYLGNKSFESLISTGVKGIMLDTRDKTGRNLGLTLNLEVLKEFVQIVSDKQLLSGLAGSLRFEDIEMLLGLRPDYLGFRGALCSNHNRKSLIDPEKVRNIRNAIPKRNNINYDLNLNHHEEIRHGTVA